MEFATSPPTELNTNSVEEIVSHLPSAQSLPDGFSVSENFPDVPTSTASALAERNRDNASESSVLPDASTGLLEVSTSEQQSTSCSSVITGMPDIGFQSPLPSADRGLKFPSDIPEIFVGNSPKQQERKEDISPNLTDFSVDMSGDIVSNVNKSTEKRRRFPVALAEGESTPSFDFPAAAHRNGLKGPLLFGVDHNKEEKGNGEEIEGNGEEIEGNGESASDSDGDDSERPSSSQASHLSSVPLRRNPSTNDEPLQDILESKIAELEVVSSGSSKSDDEESKMARARKRQVKEVKAMLDGTERNADEKLRLLNTKYLLQVSETRQMEKELLLLRRKCEQVNKEKDTIYGEYTKVSSLRQKLESLCRELQRQNKMLLDDSKRISMDEQLKRQELSTKFHNTIKDITSKLEDQGDERLQQIKENEILRENLKALSHQYEIRDEQFGHQLRTKVLEQQLAEVKLKQQQELVFQEEAKSRLYNEQLAQQLKTEKDLRSQLALYGNKFEQFQDTLTKSNEVFATFKKEMEKMTKTIKKLEKENFALKKKTEKSDVTIIELLDERASLKKQVDTSKNQKEKLEALCRSLQAERKSTFAGALPSQASLQEAMSAMEPAL